MSLEPQPDSEPTAEQIALHQRFLTLLGELEAARAEGDATEQHRLSPLLERARRRWLAAAKRAADARR